MKGNHNAGEPSVGFAPGIGDAPRFRAGFSDRVMTRIRLGDSRQEDPAWSLWTTRLFPGVAACAFGLALLMAGWNVGTADGSSWQEKLFHLPQLSIENSLQLQEGQS